MNFNDIIVFDFETCSRKAKTTQPVQLAAVAVNSRKLEIIPGSGFVSLIKPEFDDEKAIKLGIDPVEEEALSVNKIDRDDLKKAPKPKIVWQQFTEYVHSYNYKKTKWTAPVACGYNSQGFDNFIVDRLAGEKPYAFGPWDAEYKRNSLFHPIHHIDLMQQMFMWTENNRDVRSISMDNMRKWMGMGTDASHDALYDVLQGAHLLIKMLKLYRHYAEKVRFANSFEKVNGEIKDLFVSMSNA